MSVMHMIAGIVIGVIIGRVYGAFSLKKIFGGKYTFMGAGFIGSFGADLTFKYLLSKRLVTGFWYKEEIIVIEMIVGAVLACYLVSFLDRKKPVVF